MALSIPTGKPVYTTRYADFKGVDYQSTDECVDHSRFSDCENLMFDKAGLIEKRLGVRCLDKLAGEIHSMKTVNLYGKSELLIHSGNFLYKYDGVNFTPLQEEGYKRYSYLITLPSLSGEVSAARPIVSRCFGFDISPVGNSYKIKEMFAVKVSTLPLPQWPYHNGEGTIYYQKTPEQMKEILDSMTFAEINEYYRNSLKNGQDAYYAINVSPEHYYNQIPNGNFEEGAAGLSKYGGANYEIYANSMRVDPQPAGACVYAHIPVKSTDVVNLYDESVYYVTFLAESGWSGQIDFYEDVQWYNGTATPDVVRTYRLRPGLTGELPNYNTMENYVNIGDCKSSINVINNKVWITTENGSFVYDGIDVVRGEKLSYVPVTTALRNVSYTYAVADDGQVVADVWHNVPGNSLEAVNLLSRKRVNTFCLSDFCGTITTLYNNVPYTDITLDSSATSVERILYLTAEGTYKELNKMFYVAWADKVRIYSYANYAKGAAAYNNTIAFYCPVPHALDGVTENLKVYFTAKEPAEYEKKIDKCHTSTVFGIGKDDRIFVTGNEKYPNYIWYSEFENFSYMPDINYIVTGDGNTKNLGFTKVNEYLLVHKEGNDQDTTVFMVSGSLDSSGKAIFTVTQGINGVGAISERGFTNFDDMPLFLSDKGVYSVESTNIISEKTVVNRSGYVNSELLRHDLKNAAMISYDDMVLCSAGEYIYVLYPRKQSYLGKDTVYNAASFEALRWSIPDTEATIFTTFAGGLYLGTKDGRILKWNNDVQDLSKYNDTTAPGNSPVAVKCYFVTKLDDDGSFMTLKTMIKRGCGIMLKPYAQSSVDVYVLTESEHEKHIKTSGAAFLDFSEFHFGIVDFSTRKTGRIIPFNTKVKKYAALSFMVENKTLSQGFGVIGVEKRYTVGNYRKY